MTRNPPSEVADAFAAFPEDHRRGLLALRELIFDVAEELGASPLRESLKWGQPSYEAARPRESTAVRLGSTGDHMALLFHCQSSVVPQFRDLFPSDFDYDGNRAILLRPGHDLQADKLRLCIGHALRYRVR